SSDVCSSDLTWPCKAPCRSLLRTCFELPYCLLLWCVEWSPMLTMGRWLLRHTLPAGRSDVLRGQSRYQSQVLCSCEGRHVPDIDESPNKRAMPESEGAQH